MSRKWKMDLDLDYDFHRTSSAPGRLNKEPARAAIGCWIRLLYARPRLSPFIASFPFHLSLSLSIRYLEFHPSTKKRQCQSHNSPNMTTNLSFFAVPVFWLLCVLSHSYGVLIMKTANNGHWNNSAPRSSNWHETLRKSTPKDIYARYERADAAHKNGFENMPIFIGAILAGNFAQLDTRTLNLFVTLYLFARVLYTIAYISISSHRYSVIRSTIWLLSTSMCLGIFVKAGLALP
jgi:uncharacterized MAPEG superfamily protein